MFVEKVGTVIAQLWTSFVPSSTKSFSSKNPWFDGTYSPTIQEKRLYREWEKLILLLLMIMFIRIRNFAEIFDRLSAISLNKRLITSLLQTLLKISELWLITSNRFCKYLFRCSDFYFLLVHSWTALVSFILLLVLLFFLLRQGIPCPYQESYMIK